jgi:hypothetical protein
MQGVIQQAIVSSASSRLPMHVLQIQDSGSEPVNAESLFVDGEFVGDIAQVRLTPEPAPVTTMPDGSPIITVDGKGRIVGDIASIDPNIVAQLEDPKIQAQIRAMYRESRNGKQEERTPRFLNEGTRRDFTDMRPPGMSRKDWKRYRKIYFHQMTKAAKKIVAAAKRSQHA